MLKAQMMPTTGQVQTTGFDYDFSGAIPLKAQIPGGIGAFVEASVAIDQNADFTWQSISGGWTDENFDIQILYPDRTRMQTEPALAPLVVGSGVFPAEVDPAFHCRAGQRLYVKLINRTANPIDVDLLFRGIFYRAAAFR